MNMFFPLYLLSFTVLISFIYATETHVNELKFIEKTKKVETHMMH